jgi:hypothetical protein
MKAMVGVDSTKEGRLTSSTGDLKQKDEMQPMRRANTEPISSVSTLRGPKVVFETPPREVVTSRFFSGSNVKRIATVNGETVKIISDDIFDAINDDVELPVVRKLSSFPDSIFSLVSCGPTSHLIWFSIF